MATYKPIRKTASGTEEIKIPYAVLADAPDLSTFAKTADLAKVATSGSYADLINKPTSIESVIDYGDTSKKIKIGYSGAGITSDNIKYIAGFTTGDSGSIARIKDINKDAMKAWLGYAQVATSGSYNDLSDKPTIPTFDTSNLAKLDAENTFTKGQVITGGTSGGYSIDASGYIKGSWLQASSPTNKGSNTGKVCVFDGNGWIYYRTPSEILSEASGVPKSAFSLSGTTLTITI